MPIIKFIRENYRFIFPRYNLGIVVFSPLIFVWLISDVNLDPSFVKGTTKMLYVVRYALMSGFAFSLAWCFVNALTHYEKTNDKRNWYALIVPLAAIVLAILFNLTKLLLR